MSTLRKLGLLSASLAGVALGISAFNVLTWPRGRRQTEPALTRPEDVSEDPVDGSTLPEATATGGCAAHTVFKLPELPLSRLFKKRICHMRK